MTTEIQLQQDATPAQEALWLSLALVPLQQPQLNRRTTLLNRQPNEA